MLDARVATLLIIEPDHAIQDRLRAIFAADGHHTLLVDTIAEGLASLDNRRVDVILADGASVPFPGDWEALTRLRAAAGAIPIVLLSAVGLVPFAGYRARGFVGLVAKPGDGDDLSTAIAPFLAAAYGVAPVAA